MSTAGHFARGRLAAIAVVLALVSSIAPSAMAANAAGVPPGPPLISLALAGARSGPTAGAVTMQWKPPTHRGSSPVTSYLFSISIDGGHTWSAPASLGNTLFVISSGTTAIACHNTSPGSQGCRYRIFAANSSGIGSPSKDVALWVAPSAPPPRSVTIDTAFAQALLLWGSSTVDGGFPVTYTVLASMDSAPFTPVTTTTDRGAVVACTASQTCAYRVRADNSQGSSPLGEAESIITAPGAPKIATASNVGRDLGSGITSVDVSWTAPQTGMTATSYQLQRCAIPAGATTGCNVSSGAWGHTAVVAPVVSGPVTTTQLCGQGVATCRYRVRALNARGGAGAWQMKGIEPWAPFHVHTSPGATKGTVSVTFYGPAESGAGATAAKHYQVLFCTSSCTEAARWRDSGLKIPYPPKGKAPFAAGTFACKNPVTTSTCSVRMRFIDGLGHMSPLTSVVIGSPRR